MSNFVEGFFRERQFDDLQRNGGIPNTNIEIRSFAIVDIYYVSTVGKNEKKITEYIQNQLKEDYMSEQLVLDMTDPFTGSRK